MDSLVPFFHVIFFALLRRIRLRANGLCLLLLFSSVLPFLLKNIV